MANMGHHSARTGPADDQASMRFEIACRVKDTKPSNLNEVFAKYGCNTLEAKVPVVNSNVAEKLKNASYEDQTYGTLELKSTSASNAVEGRLAPTRDRPLHLVNVGRDTLIAAGKQRERCPVEREDLDNELEEYMRETARIRMAKAKEREARAKLAENVPSFGLPDFKRHFPN